MISTGVSGLFIDIKSFRSHCGPGVDSASNRNEHQDYFLGGKGGRCVSLTTLPPSCAVVTKSGNLNFLEPLSRAREPGRLNLLCFVSLCCFGLRGMNDVYSAVMRTLAVEGEEGRREGKGKVEGAALGDFGG